MNTNNQRSNAIIKFVVMVIIILVISVIGMYLSVTVLNKNSDNAAESTNETVTQDSTLE